MNCVFNKWSPAAVAAVALISLAVATEASAQTAASDGEGAALRAPTAAEAKVLVPATASTTAERRVGMVTGKVNPAAIVHSDGTVEQELDASTMSYTVARTNADGSISMVCVTGDKAAQKAMTSKGDRAKLAVSKGHTHETK